MFTNVSQYGRSRKCETCQNPWYINGFYLFAAELSAFGVKMKYQLVNKWNELPQYQKDKYNWLAETCFPGPNINSIRNDFSEKCSDCCLDSHNLNGFSFFVTELREYGKHGMKLASDEWDKLSQYGKDEYHWLAKTGFQRKTKS